MAIPAAQPSDAFTASEQGPISDRAFSSVASYLQARVPVFVPCFNNPTYLQNMIRQLKALRFQRIVVIDNASTYPPMLELLSILRRDATVIFNNVNKGARHIFMENKCYALLPQLFCVTDPDLEFNAELPSDFVSDLAWLTGKYRVGKAGFSLDISDRARLREDDFFLADKEYKIWEWEEQFWREPLEQLPSGDQVYRAPIDTTFAVYNKTYFRRSEPLEAVRVAGRYTCQHIPWYKDTRLPSAEESFYRRIATRFGNYHKQNSEHAHEILLSLYRLRPDLQSAFPEVKVGQLSRLCDWASGVCQRQWEDVAHDILKPCAKWYPILKNDLESSKVDSQSPELTNGFPSDSEAPPDEPKQ